MAKQLFLRTEHLPRSVIPVVVGGEKCESAEHRHDVNQSNGGVASYPEIAAETLGEELRDTVALHIPGVSF